MFLFQRKGVGSIPTSRIFKRGKMIEEYVVRKILSGETYPWLLKIHYAKRLPSITNSFGLFSITNKVMVGVITFGLPPCPTETVFWDNNLVELNRLVVQENLPKNVLSFFVSQSLKMLPNNIVVISYSDMDMGHHGYIYQATNWIYTGIGSINTKTFVMKDGRERHERHKYLIEMNSVTEIKYSKGKHRYYYFVGDKKFKREMFKKLENRFDILPYPKGINNRYNINDNICKQKTLF